jgi:nucleoside-diphosphate-sugar epimerase
MKCLSKQHKQKVLITGGAGFIGTHLRILLEEDASAEVIPVDSRPSEKGLVLNLACGESVQAAVRNGLLPKKIDCIVHLAARLVSADNPKDTTILLDNIKMAGNVACLAEALSAEKVIHASSMAVYPNRTGVYSEESITNAVWSAEGLYGLSKICSEQLIDFLLKGTLIKTVHMRFAQVYGEGMRSDRIIPMMKQE